MKETRLLFLASGRGSNFAAIADAVKRGEIPNAKIVGLLANKPAAALELAQARGVSAQLVEAAKFRRADGKWDRAAYEEALDAEIRKREPDLICLAGYMLLLGKKIVSQWAGRIVNIHPSLLPSFKGLNAQQQAVDYGVRWSGCSVHLVTEDLDAGPILEQSILEVLPEDTGESLSQRLLPLEHQTYVRALKKLCSQRYRLQGQRIIWDQ
jgi:phosphoribosylglycinamide formyltransferase-1